MEQTIAAHPEALTTLLRRKRPDGSTAYLHGTLKAAQVDGRWLIIINVRDVTAEREIRLRVQRFTRAFDLSGDAVLLIDCESVAIADLNETACRMTGYSREELLRLEPHRLTAGVQDAQALRSVLEEMIGRSPQIEMREFRAVRKDGGVFDAEAQCVALQSGGRWIVVATIRDVSQRKAAQTRLEQFRLALDQSQDSLLLIDRETMRLVYVNQEAARRAGMTQEECLQRLTPWHALIDVTGDMLARFFDRVISRAPQSLVRRSVYRRWDGTTYPGESLVTAVQVDGRWLILVSTRDVSEREATLRRLERFRAAMDQAGSRHRPDRPGECSIPRREPDRQSEMFGYPKAELLRLGPAGVERHGDADELRRRYAALLEKPGHTEMEETSFTRADGSSFHAEASTRLMRSGDSWVVIRVVRDVTERHRNRAELERRMQELQRSNEELERFGYVASHDLSEPLRTLGSYAQLLQRRYDHLLDADGREFIAFMTDASQRMKRMLDDLLMYSRAGRTAGAPASGQPPGLGRGSLPKPGQTDRRQGRPGRSPWPSDGVRRPRVADAGAAEPDCQRAQVLRAGPAARGQCRLCGGRVELDDLGGGQRHRHRAEILRARLRRFPAAAPARSVRRQRYRACRVQEDRGIPRRQDLDRIRAGGGYGVPVHAARRPSLGCPAPSPRMTLASTSSCCVSK